MSADITGKERLRFRKLEAGDYQLLLEWLRRPHVKRWWDDGDDTIEKIASHYSRDPETTKRFLLLVSNDLGPERPMGYFQYYLTADGAGVDQFLSEESALGKGLGTRALKQFIDLVCSRENPVRIIVDPDSVNTRAIKCYEKVGFRHKTGVSVDGKSFSIMEIRIEHQLASERGQQILLER